MRTQPEWHKLLTEGHLRAAHWDKLAEFVLGDLAGYRHDLPGEDSDKKSLANLLAALVHEMGAKQ